MNKYTVYDLIGAAVEQRPIDFENAFAQLITPRLEDGVNELKIDVAKDMFAHKAPDNSREE
jgi:hypothetical protein